MKIKVIETFGHETGCHVAGREYVVPDELGREVVAANLAVEVTTIVEEKLTPNPDQPGVVIEKLTPNKKAK